MERIDARSSEAEEDGVGGEDNGDEIARLAIDALEIDLLAARARPHRAELEPDEEPAEGEQEAEHPEHERRADAPDGPQDRGRRREDARPDDPPDAVCDSAGTGEREVRRT